MKGKVACVTGADRGLGYELAIALARKGYVVFAGRYMTEWTALDHIPAELSSLITPILLDISNEDSALRAASTIEDQYGKLDLLVNNAGIAGNHDSSVFGGIDYELIRRMYEVNTLGPLRMTQALSGLLVQGDDKLVVNISSEAGQINQTWREGWYGYCMSKAALNVQTNIVHNELRSRGGKAIAIHPGWMKTYMGGKRNENAAIEAEEAASGIVDIIIRYALEENETAHPPFVDYAGSEMHW
ncbi:SDR family NAD(P)-dependent oxidoreductase [Paenibacillus sp. YAF4_2]|uniref:SDR family NAD(P)-dependent oxidoreductase n=1 Tax=Paenibacillus sp. YAF4_2 TaxID=3233085 RepID=UPI003F98A7DB